MSELNEKNVVEKALQILPETRGNYDNEVQFNDGLVLPHVIFGDVFRQYIVSLLMENQNRETIKIAFDFFEKMATSGNKYIEDLLVSSVLEVLGDDPKILQISKEYMGNQTKVLSDQIERWLGRII